MDPVDAARIIPGRAAPQRGRRDPQPGQRCSVEVQAGVPLAGLRSPSHAIDTESCGGAPCRAVLRGPVPANKDFVLDWSAGAGRGASGGGDHREEGRPPLRAAHGRAAGARGIAARPIPREAIFVIDTSGSMQGASIAQAREALELAIRRLSAGDRFNVIEFNSYAQRALPGRASGRRRKTWTSAVRWVRGLRAHGGTEMAKALDLALDGRETPGRIRQVVFLTDGAVGNEDYAVRA